MLIMEVNGVVKRELLILKTCLRTLQKYVFFCMISDIFVGLVKNALMKYVSICTIFSSI